MRVVLPPSGRNHGNKQGTVAKLKCSFIFQENQPKSTKMCVCVCVCVFKLNVSWIITCSQKAFIYRQKQPQMLIW